MRNDRYWHIVPGVALVALLVFGAVPVVEAQSPGQDDHRKNSLSVYLWGASVSGNLGYHLGDEPFEISLQDLMENLKMTGMLAYRRNIGDWSLLIDLVYLNMSGSKNDSVTLPIGDGVPIDTDASLDIKTWVGGLYGGYIFSRSQASKHEIIVGARYFSMSTDLHLEADGPGGTPLIDRSFSPSAKLWDGVVGIEGHFALGGRWSLPYHLDVGAGNSELTYQVLAGAALGFRWGDLSLTYRYLYYDEGEGGLVKDMSIKGPVVAAGFRF
jgi:hypothetical protein